MAPPGGALLCHCSDEKKAPAPCYICRGSRRSSRSCIYWLLRLRATLEGGRSNGAVISPLVTLMLPISFQENEWFVFGTRSVDFKSAGHCGWRVGHAHVEPTRQWPESRWLKSAETHPLKCSNTVRANSISFVAALNDLKPCIQVTWWAQLFGTD